MDLHLSIIYNDTISVNQNSVFVSVAIFDNLISIGLLVMHF